MKQYSVAAKTLPPDPPTHLGLIEVVVSLTVNAKILGTGSYLPEKLLTNIDLEQLIDTTDAWIVERTGIRERHVAADNEFTSDLAKVAAERALQAVRGADAVYPDRVRAGAGHHPQKSHQRLLACAVQRILRPGKLDARLCCRERQ